MAVDAPSFRDWLVTHELADAPRPPTPPTLSAVAGDNRKERYARATLTRLAADVANAADGVRNQTLNDNTLRAYRVAAACGLPGWPEVEAEMTAAAIRCGLHEDREGRGLVGVQATITSARQAADREGPADITLDEDTPPAQVIGAADDCQDQEPKLAPFLINRTGLANLPDPAPLIDETLDQGTMALLYGKWGSYKTFIAFDWGASVATGRPWQGRPTEQRRTLYVAAEGAFGFKGRAAAWEAGWRTTIRDDNLHILPRAVNLTNAADVAELVALVDWNGYGFVIVDTLARCMVGADENSAKDCGQVVDALTRLREHTPDGRGVVLGVHHTGKDGKTFRGSSVFEAGADTVYSVTKDGAMIALDREKRKDGPQDDRLYLKLDMVPGTDSAVIGAHPGVGTTDRVGKLLTIFDAHFGTTGATKSELREAALQAGMANTTYYRAIDDLVRRGDIKNTGTDARPFYKRVGK